MFVCEDIALPTSAIFLGDSKAGFEKKGLFDCEPAIKSENVMIYECCDLLNATVASSL